MMTPSIHLNGTSGDELLAQATDAGAALRRAIDAMQAAAPNARDYYPQGDAAFEVARKEHLSRLERVSSVLVEYEQLAEAIADARDARRR